MPIAASRMALERAQDGWKYLRLSGRLERDGGAVNAKSGVFPIRENS